jgi:hypothetical protein
MTTFLICRVPWLGALFAEGTLRSFFTGGSARDRIVQLCVVCMALALLILMKKFAPDGQPSSADPSQRRRRNS